MANSKYGRKGEVRWNNARKVYPDIPTPTSSRHGRRPLGQQDISDTDPNVDKRKIMPLPWICPHCSTAHLMYAMNCKGCGRLTPMGAINWKQ